MREGEEGFAPGVRAVDVLAAKEDVLVGLAVEPGEGGLLALLHDHRLHDAGSGGEEPGGGMGAGELGNDQVAGRIRPGVVRGGVASGLAASREGDLQTILQDREGGGLKRGADDQQVRLHAKILAVVPLELHHGLAGCGVAGGVESGACAVGDSAIAIGSGGGEEAQAVDPSSGREERADGEILPELGGVEAHLRDERAVDAVYKIPY